MKNKLTKERMTPKQCVEALVYEATHEEQRLTADEIVECAEAINDALEYAEKGK